MADGHEPERVELPLSGRVRAVIFDVDGTLYDVRLMRQAMARQLLVWLVCHPFRARSAMRVIRRFRRAQEDLRDGQQVNESASLFDAQLAPAAEAAGVSMTQARAVVEEWMFRRPLAVLGNILPADVPETLVALGERGIKIGLYSDYPARDKMEAMGIADRFDAIVLLL